MSQSLKQCKITVQIELQCVCDPTGFKAIDILGNALICFLAESLIR